MSEEEKDLSGEGEPLPEAEETKPEIEE